MGQDTEQLKREIEVTRSGEGETLGAIGDRVSPGHVAQRQKNKVVGAVRSAKDRAMGTVQDTQSQLSHSVDAEGSPMVVGADLAGRRFGTLGTHSAPDQLQRGRFR